MCYGVFEAERVNVILISLSLLRLQVSSVIREFQMSGNTSKRIL